VEQSETQEESEGQKKLFWQVKIEAGVHRNDVELTALSQLQPSLHLAKQVPVKWQ
jgi:hypothetical protein